jgi:hypothetical protein
MPDQTSPADDRASQTEPGGWPPTNRAERRAARRGAGPRPDGPHADGKVRGSAFDHAPDPRRYAAHRRG